MNPVCRSGAQAYSPLSAMGESRDATMAFHHPSRQPWSLPASSGATHDGFQRLSPQTLRGAIQTLATLGFVVLRAPVWWADGSLDAAQARITRSLEQLKLEYEQFRTLASTGRRPLPTAPWEHLKQGPATSLQGGFTFQEGFSYTKGRLNMPLLAGTAPFDAPPFRAHPDLVAVCSALYHGACNRTIVGALWNFPGANTTFWHRDYPEEWQLITVVTALRDLPLNAGWLHVQPETHQTGAFSPVLSGRPPLSCCGEPQLETTVLRRGDTLIFTATTKHAVTPNPSAVERGLMYSIYAVDGRRDTWNTPDGAPSLRTLLGRARAGTLTPSIAKGRRLVTSLSHTVTPHRDSTGFAIDFTKHRRAPVVHVDGCGLCAAPRS